MRRATIRLTVAVYLIFSLTIVISDAVRSCRYETSAHYISHAKLQCLIIYVKPKYEENVRLFIRVLCDIQQKYFPKNLYILPEIRYLISRQLHN